jgi:hypothetical protein
MNILLSVDFVCSHLLSFFSHSFLERHTHNMIADQACVIPAPYPRIMVRGKLHAGQTPAGIHLHFHKQTVYSVFTHLLAEIAQFKV